MEGRGRFFSHDFLISVPEVREKYKVSLLNVILGLAAMAI